MSRNRTHFAQRSDIRAKEPIVRALLTEIAHSDLSDREIEDRAGVCFHTLNRLRRGEISARIITLASLAEVVGLRLKWEHI